MNLETFSSSYLNILENELKGLNLTAIKDFDSFHLKQTLDSALPYQVSAKFKDAIDNSSVVIDIGCGGGFPLFPLALCSLKKKFIGIDARNKKIEAVKLIAKKLGLLNVDGIHLRAEDLLIDIDNVVITSKAVGTIDKVLASLNLLNPAMVFLYKGPNFFSIEAKQLETITNDWDIIERAKIDVPGTEQRWLIGVQNKKVPRGTLNNKSLIKLSEIMLRC